MSKRSQFLADLKSAAIKASQKVQPQARVLSQLDRHIVESPCPQIEHEDDFEDFCQTLPSKDALQQPPSAPVSTPESSILPSTGLIQAVEVEVESLIDNRPVATPVVLSPMEVLQSLNEACSVPSTQATYTTLECITVAVPSVDDDPNITFAHLTTVNSYDSPEPATQGTEVDLQQSEPVTTERSMFTMTPDKMIIEENNNLDAFDSYQQEIISTPKSSSDLNLSYMRSEDGSNDGCNTDGNLLQEVEAENESNSLDNTLLGNTNSPKAKRSLFSNDDSLHMSDNHDAPSNDLSTLDAPLFDLEEVESALNTEQEASKRKRKYTPPEKLTRKRNTNSTKWKRSEAQRMLASGQEHVSVKGVKRRARSIQKGCDASCRILCQANLTPDERQSLFEQFWKIPTQKEKWDFIALHVDFHPIKEANDLTTRTSARKYYFRIDGEKIRVCKVMFLDTLDICDSLVETTAAKLKMGGYISPDKRKRHHEASPTLKAAKETVRQHIAIIPRMPSHYNRADSNKEYITEHFQSVADMYGAYKEWMSAQNPEQKLATERQYRDVFNTEYNISFFLSKKDVCDDCTTWLNTPEEARTTALEEEHNKHIENKEVIREMLDKDKALARHKDSKNICLAHFDYEKNLICPKANTSVFYYRRKLKVSNFTIVDVGRFEDCCYVYDETIGHKGSNEVASFLLHFIKRKVESGVTQFRFYSDNCWGQNKNRNVGSLYAYASAKYNISIDHVYLEKGHTYNAADTVHSHIERKTKPLQIYTPRQWYDNIATAKRSKSHPIIVVEVTQDMIYQWNDLSEKLQLDKDIERKNISWTTLRQISANGSSVHEFKIKADLKEEFRVVSTKKVGKPVNFSTFKLEKAYSGPLPIAIGKHNDLLYYCSNNHIPVEYHDFYKSINSSETVPDEVLETAPTGRAKKRKKTVMPKATKPKKRTSRKTTVVASDDEEHNSDS